MTRPLTELCGELVEPGELCGPIRALFSDIDGTMTTGAGLREVIAHIMSRRGK